MSQGFLTFPDIHPILVGAGCLALGYVYGRHCRSAGIGLREDGVPLASDDVCCAQSRSNTYFDDLQRPCACCVSAPAEMDAMAAAGRGKKNGSSKFTRSPYLVQDAAEGFEHAERSTKRDLAHRMEKHEDADGEAHRLRSRDSSRPCFLMLEEERLLQAKTPCKKQKGAPVVKESLVDCPSKGKAEMDLDHRLSYHEPSDDAAAAAAACVPWSREVLHRRIDYFNNVSETTADSSGRSDESRKLRLIKKKFLKVAQGDDYNSISTTASSNIGPAAAAAADAAVVTVRSGSTSGLVELATQDHRQAADGLDPGPGNDGGSPLDSRHRLSGGGWNSSNNVAGSAREHLEAPETALSCFGNWNTASINHAMEQASCEAKYDGKQGSELESTSAVAGSFQSVTAAAGYEALLNDVSMATQGASAASRRALAEEHYGRGALTMREAATGDEMLKAEIVDLLAQTDSCTQVSFEEIITRLEERLQMDLQGSQARVAELVREVGGTAELLETERRPIATEDARPSLSEQDVRATAVHNHVISRAVGEDYYAASSSSTWRPGAAKLS